MAIYFSERAAQEYLGYGEVEGNSLPDPTIGIEILGIRITSPINARRRQRTLREQLLQAASDHGKEWIRPADAEIHDLVDLQLRDVAYGAYRTLMIGGTQKPIWTFLMHGEGVRRGISPAVSIMGVGSVDNYRRYAGDEQAKSGVWFPSSPEGRAEVYNALGIVSREDRDREFSICQTTIEEESKAGRQIELFSDLLHTLNHNHSKPKDEWKIDHYDGRLSHARILGVVVDSDRGTHASHNLLVRPILLEH